MYETGGVTFWIMRNLDHLVAAWSGGDPLSVSVSASLTEEELYPILDAMGAVLGSWRR